MQASQVQHPSLSSPQYPILSRPSPIQESLSSYSSSPTVRGHISVQHMYRNTEAGPSTEQGNPVHSSSLRHDLSDFRLPTLQQLFPPSSGNTQVVQQKGLESGPSAEPGSPDHSSSVSDSPSISPPPKSRPPTPLPAASPALTVRPGVPVQRSADPGPSTAAGYPVHTSSSSHHAQPTPSQQPVPLPSSTTQIFGRNIPGVPQRSAQLESSTRLAPMEFSLSQYRLPPFPQPLPFPLSTPMSRGNTTPAVYQRSAEPGLSTQPGHPVNPQTSSQYPAPLRTPASQQPLPPPSTVPTTSMGNAYSGVPPRNSAPPTGTVQGYPIHASVVPHQPPLSRPAILQQQQPLAFPPPPPPPPSSAQALPGNDPEARQKNAEATPATQGRYPLFSTVLPDIPMAYDLPSSGPVPFQQQQQQGHQQQPQHQRPSSAAPMIWRNIPSDPQRNAEADSFTAMRQRYVYDTSTAVPIIYDPPLPRTAASQLQQQPPQQPSAIASATLRNIPAPRQENAEAGPSTAPRYVYVNSPGVPMVRDPPHPPTQPASSSQQQQQPQSLSLPPPVSTPLTERNISASAEAEPSNHPEDSVYNVSPDGSMVCDPPPSGPAPSQQQPLPPPPPPPPPAAASFAPAFGGHAPAVHQRSAETGPAFARGHVFAPSSADYYLPSSLRPAPSQQQQPFPPPSSTPVTARNIPINLQRSSEPRPSTEPEVHILTSSTIKLARYSNKYAVGPDGRKIKSRDCVADLATMERRAQQHHLQAQLQAESAAAEDSLAAKEAQEARALLHAAGRGMDYTTLDLQTGVEVARAARERLAAEEQALLRKHALLFFERQIILDGLAETRAQVADARSQSAWMDAMQARHVPKMREASSLGLFS